jgi:FlaA1/EpsC-like NDP-sugar epimerase
MRARCFAGNGGTTVNTEALATDSSVSLQRGASARQWLVSCVRRLVRSVTEAGYDAIVWVSGLCYAAWVTGDIAAGSPVRLLLAGAVLAVPVLSVLCGLLAGLYRGRHPRGSIDEVISVFVAGGLMLVPLALLSGVIGGQRDAMRTVAGGALIALPTIAVARYVVFTMRHGGLHLRRQRHSQPAAGGVSVIVFGAGGAGTALIRRLLDEPEGMYRPVAILDDDPAKRRLRVYGVPVLGNRTKMAEVAATTGSTVLVIALSRASGSAIRDLTARAEQCGLTPKVVPTTTELISGGARIEGVRDPRISDLLGRRQIKTDVRAIAGHFTGKRILVTGAGGSIGSELCRQLHEFGPAELTMLDRDESALHEIQLTLHGRALLDSDETVLADIRDRRRIREVFDRFRPEIVFHAAALKHLPLLERYPAEAVQSNILGTQTVLEAAAACGTESFVNISTDKAANPVSVLGYSKKIAERLTAHMAGQASGSYLSVRFGNVLGSRGSVLGALSAQVKAGGPLTVTHPEVTRYFMTVDEAVQLVLQAAVIGGSGEVLILDMGEPMRIADIARRLVAQAAHPVDIVYTGLRPGEKLTEDLLGNEETDHRPRHPLIRHAQVKPLDPDELAGLSLDGGEGELRAGLAQYAMAAAAAPVPAKAVPVDMVPGVPVQVQAVPLLRLAPTGTADAL